MTPRQPINSKFSSLWHGGDYNPEQWPSDIWDEDMEYMRLAGVNAVSVGIFSWVSLEPEEGVFTFDWLDQILDKLHQNGVHAILATPSAAPPAWMSQKYPETLRVGADRVRRLHGNRVNYNWASSLYREKTAEMAERLANRYGKHPALAMWHVSNEYGGEDFSEDSRLAFIQWLKTRYSGSLTDLNEAYWSAFWGHTYTDWDQIQIPGQPYSESAIHGLNIDWRRFVSDQILEFFLNESAPLRRITPDVPITTNMMGHYEGLDPWKWKDHVDVFTWDSYPGFTEHPRNGEDLIKVGFIHDMYRTIKEKPFLLIESTPSSSNWYSSMRLKRPGLNRLEAMQAVAHGSDGVMYFQWRASRGSQEKYHGAVVSHAGGPGRRVFEEVAEVGRDLQALSDVVGTYRQPEVAIIYDWESNWALSDSCGPVLGNKGHFGAALSNYRAFWEQSIPCAVIDSDQPLDKYRVVVAPMLYMLKPGVAARLSEFVAAGGTLVTTYLSGLVNESDLAFLRDRDWPLESLLGIFTEEIDPLFPDEKVVLSADLGQGVRTYEANRFCDLIETRGAEVLGEYQSEFYAGRPFLTRNSFGEGKAWYVAARTDQAFLNDLHRHIATELNLERDIEGEMPEKVMAVRRGDRLFILNFSEENQTVEYKGRTLTLEPYGCVIEQVEVLAPSR